MKGVLVSWEREPRPSPDAEALPRDGVLSPDWRKCSVRAGKGWAWITVSCLHCRRMGRLNHSAPSLRPEPHVVFINNKLVKNEKGGKNMENSFMTHRDDREDYSVVHAKTPLVGFFLQQRWNKPL